MLSRSPMTPHEALEKYFGFREFLDAQEEVIDAIVGGADALVVMPTGGGKSLCYQLPALMLEGTTVVVSPLIALMKDQVDALQRRGIAATLINSSLSLASNRNEFARLPAANTNSFTSRRNVSAADRSSKRWDRRRSRSSLWTKRIVSRCGATIFVPIIFG